MFWTVRWSLWLGAPLSHLPLALAAVATALPVVALLRAGLLGSVAFGLFGFALVDLPVTLDRSAWYAPTGFTVLATLAALAAAAFRTATAERAAPEG